MSYERMEKRAAELEAEVGKWLEEAEATDAEEDTANCPSVRGGGVTRSSDALISWLILCCLRRP
jgi:hypothetical protein